MKPAFEDRRFNDDQLTVVSAADEICRAYARQGDKLTLRQLYYRFIADDRFPESWRDATLGTKNVQKNYKRLGTLMTDARISGLIGWDRIEDRTREASGGDFGWLNPEQRIQGVPQGYMITKRDGQPVHVEAWVEKEALVSLIERPASRWNVTTLACKGSPSTSVMYEAAKRLRRHERAGQDTLVYYLGDHDPTGLDTDRDVQERLRMLGSRARVERIALTMDQIEELNPPPSPVKVTDSRTNGYIDTYGTEDCWELDALPPDQLRTLVEDAILSQLDRNLWNDRERQEQRDLVELQALADNWDAVRDYMDREGLLDYTAADEADEAAQDDNEDE